MANEQNLKPYKKGELSSEEAKRRGSKGGKAKAKKERERKSMQELAKMILSLPMRNESLDDVEAFNELKKKVEKEDGTLAEVAKNMTVAQAALFAQANKAIKGDAHALTFLRDTAGEKPIEKVEVSGDIQAASQDIKEMIASFKAQEDDGS